jgi:hypothetical protein
MPAKAGIPGMDMRHPPHARRLDLHHDQQAARRMAWNRDWKIRLIEEQNPEWRDLFDFLV